MQDVWKENETVAHIVSSCEKLTQKYYKQWRHDKVAQILHWNLCKKYDLQAATKFYDHVPEKVSENDLVKILWDFNIQTDKKLEHNKQDITLHDKKNNECLLIEVFFYIHNLKIYNLTKHIYINDIIGSMIGMPTLNDL